MVPEDLALSLLSAEQERIVMDPRISAAAEEPAR